MKFSIKGFLRKCDQIHNSLRIWSHLLNKSINPDGSSPVMWKLSWRESHDSIMKNIFQSSKKNKKYALLNEYTFEDNCSTLTL